MSGVHDQDVISIPVTDNGPVEVVLNEPFDLASIRRILYY